MCASWFAAAFFLLPESPRWLVVQGKLDAALAAMHRVYTNNQLPQGGNTPLHPHILHTTPQAEALGCGKGGERGGEGKRKREGVCVKEKERERERERERAGTGRESHTER
jgi:hypothetical protein